MTPQQQALQRIRAEYLEMPGLSLTPDQVRRLCGVERAACDAALGALVEANFLCVRSDGSYTRVTDGLAVAPRPLRAELQRSRSSKPAAKAG
jgi:hypothetical protein